MAVAAVKRARNYTDDVEFSCEDAGRTGIDNICRIVEAAINAGATTVNIPDTVGFCLPNEYGNIYCSSAQSRAEYRQSCDFCALPQ